MTNSPQLSATDRTSRHAATRVVLRTSTTAATASLLLYHCHNFGLPVTSSTPNITGPHPPYSSTNPHGGSHATSAPSRFPTTSALPQALPRLPSFPTTSSSGTPTAATAPSCFPNVFFRHSHSPGYIGRSPKLYLRYGIRAAET